MLFGCTVTLRHTYVVDYFLIELILRYLELLSELRGTKAK